MNTLLENRMYSRKTSYSGLWFGAIAWLSLGPLAPAWADTLPPPPDRPQLDINGVDVQTGDFTYSKKDLSIGSGNIGSLSYTRFYNNSTGWRDSFSNALDTSENPNLGLVYQTAAIDNISESFDGFNSTLSQGSRMDGAPTGLYTRKDGMQVSFGHLYLSSTTPDTVVSVAVADSISFANGVVWTLHNTDAMGGGFNNTRIQSVTSNTGYQLKFYYASNTMTSDWATRGPWNKIVKVVAINNAYEYCDPDADSCTLLQTWPNVTYGACGTISECSTDSLNNQTRYTIEFVSGVTSFKVKTPDSANDNIVYNVQQLSTACVNITTSPCYIGGNNRVSSATLNGVTTNYSYSYNGSTKSFTITASGPLSSHDVYISSAVAPGITSHTDSLSHTNTFTYDVAGRLLSAAASEGNFSSFSPDGNANITQTVVHAKSGSGLSNLTESRVYGSCFQVCENPTSITDPRGNTTSFTYDSTHGGVLTETGPAVNGIQPVKRYAYVQRYAWYKNSVGSYVQAATPVWILSEMRTCLTSATVGNACAAGSSDEVVTTYDYGPNSGPNNLFLRGKTVASNGTTLRTCYGYDRFGNKISETSPNAGLASCS